MNRIIDLLNFFPALIIPAACFGPMWLSEDWAAGPYILSAGLLSMFFYIRFLHTRLARLERQVQAQRRGGVNSPRRS